MISSGSGPMRKITQFVALMVALLLAGPSVLADAPCSQYSDRDHSPECRITTNHGTGHKLAADCNESMSSATIATECNQSGCRMTTVKVVAQVFTTTKSETDAAASLLGPVQLPVPLTPGLLARTFESVSAPVQPKYLLFQVFRI